MFGKCIRLLTLCILVFPGMHKFRYNIHFCHRRVAWCFHFLQLVYKIHDMAYSTTVFVLDDIERLHSWILHKRCWIPGNNNNHRLGYKQNCYCHNSKCCHFQDICLHREIEYSNYIQFLSRQQKSMKSAKQVKSSF